MLIPGEMVDDIKIVGLAGSGGMALVYMGKDMNTHKNVALKILREEHSSDTEIIDLFLTEADLSLLIHHPNLMKAHRIGQYKNTYYLVMDFWQGFDLAQILRFTDEHFFRFSVEASVMIISEVLDGLDYFHSLVGKDQKPLRLVHRDVTPQNILISYEGDIVLIDYGAALIAAHGTATEIMAVGKLRYMAPELLLQNQVSAQTDIFSAGVVLWEMLAGQKLFHGETEVEVQSQIAFEKYPPPVILERFDKPIAEVVKKSLDRDPDSRFQTVRQFYDALQNALENSGYDSGALLKTKIQSDELYPLLQKMKKNK